MSKIILIDSKMNSTVIDVTPQTLRMLGIKPEDIKKHKSRRQLLMTLDDFIKKYKNI